MNKRWIALLAVAAMVPAAQAQGNEGNWLVRARALHLDSANKDSTGLGLSINNKTFPEVDISYFVTPNLALELILTYPQKQDLRSSALGGKIGDLKHLPPTLSLQYHFTGLGAVRPYVGAGLNYTRFSSVNLPAGVTIEKDSFGFAYGAGLDVPFAKNWVFNIDVKKVQIRTDVFNAGAKIGTLKVDPLLFGVGVGYRF